MDDDRDAFTSPQDSEGISMAEYGPLEERSADDHSLIKSPEQIDWTDDPGYSAYTFGFLALAKGAIGSGVLGLPAALKTTGWLVGIFVVLFTWTGSLVGQAILFKCAFRCGGRDTSWFNLARKSFNWLPVLADFAIAFKCIGVSCSYLMFVYVSMLLIRRFGRRRLNNNCVFYLDVQYCEIVDASRFEYAVWNSGRFVAGQQDILGALGRCRSCVPVDVPQELGRIEVHIGTRVDYCGIATVVCLFLSSVLFVIEFVLVFDSFTFRFSSWCMRYFRTRWGRARAAFVTKASLPARTRSPIWCRLCLLLCLLSSATPQYL
jgi:hypothetical protein